MKKKTPAKKMKKKKKKKKKTPAKKKKTPTTKKKKKTCRTRNEEEDDLLRHCRISCATVVPTCCRRRGIITGRRAMQSLESRKKANGRWLSESLCFLVVCVTNISIILRPKLRIIIMDKSTGHLSGLQYICSLLNCLICLWYGLPFVSPNVIMIATVNSVGAIFQLIYITTFIIYAEKARKVKTTGLLVSVFGVFAIISLVSMKLDPLLRRTFVGYLSLASFVSLFATSLSIIDLVIRMKSVEFLSFYPSLSTFMMSASFFSYGMLKHDAFIYVILVWFYTDFQIPNGIGAILGVTHLSLYAYYNRESREEEFRQSLIRSF
ncbi:bidirectional sugar transporter SWEET2a [Cinnamomum micranthum f. kanehirae]|uniref:Bidirectional sugar transporter SWEET n=1 Tax=Cinnamomum micranthum f. kanehirae TaxID=337451 RepID=A0A443P6B7_9MAGN|nr:bidirectional sugar transporter SWEET2a [Cinnamomum micranthum f. kanehirae]